MGARKFLAGIMVVLLIAGASGEHLAKGEQPDVTATPKTTSSDPKKLLVAAEAGDAAAMTELGRKREGCGEGPDRGCEMVSQGGRCWQRSRNE